MQTCTISSGKYKCKDPETGTSVLYLRNKRKPNSPKVRSRGKLKRWGQRGHVNGPLACGRKVKSGEAK